MKKSSILGRSWLLILSCVIVLSCAKYNSGGASSSMVRINEVLSANYRNHYDRKNLSSDWIEIINTGEFPVELEGWGLSDSDKNPYKFIFPKITLEPSGYLLVRASGLYDNTGSELHAPFKIKAKGEEILLSNSYGKVIDLVMVPELETNFSYGRTYSDAEQWAVLSEATPGGINTEALASKEKIGPLVANLDAPWCVEGTELILSCHESTVTIHYTLDGSEPDLGSPILSGPLVLFSKLIPDESLTQESRVTEGYTPPKVVGPRAMVVRAKAYAPGLIPSDIFTGTYFFTDVFSSRTMPVLLLTLAPEDLMDEEDGVYVLGEVYEKWRDRYPQGTFQGDTPANYNQRGPAWRKNANIQLVDGDGGFSTQGVFKLLGGWSRASAQKSFQLFFYPRGDTTKGLGYELFPGLVSRDGTGQRVDFFRSVIFRNGGNDWPLTLYRDALIQSLVSPLPLETQASRPVVVYLNGEYWGILNMREAYDEGYFSEHYGLPLDQSVVYEGNGLVKTGGDEEGAWYAQLLEDVRKTDFSQDTALDLFKDRIDFDNHALYTAVQLWIANKDWPGNNIRFWRAKGQGTDGMDEKLRWLLFDTEFSFNIYDQNHYVLNMFKIINDARGPDWPNPPWSTFLVRQFLKNDEYKRLLINACCDLMNTVFNSSSVEQEIERMEGLYGPEMEKHWSRWSWAAGGSMSGWQRNAEAIRFFAQKRETFFPRHMEAFFNLLRPRTIMVLVGEGGKVILNNLTLRSGGFEGLYYPGQAITVTAIPDEGFVFKGWKGSHVSSDTSVTLDPKDEIHMEALFTPF